MKKIVFITMVSILVYAICACSNSEDQLSYEDLGPLAQAAMDQAKDDEDPTDFSDDSFGSTSYVTDDGILVTETKYVYLDEISQNPSDFLHDYMGQTVVIENVEVSDCDDDYFTSYYDGILYVFNLDSAEASSALCAGDIVDVTGTVMNAGEDVIFDHCSISE